MCVTDDDKGGLRDEGMGMESEIVNKDMQRNTRCKASLITEGHLGP